MQLTEEQIKVIKDKFAIMQSIDDLVDLLNFVNPLLYPINHQDKISPIRKKSLTFYANSTLSGSRRYKEFLIKKKSGGERKISAPNKSLKLIQSTLNAILSVIFEPKDYVTGFVPQKSIVDNAKVHVGKNYVYNIDLKNFFPSIELHRIKAVLKLEPFSLYTPEREKLAFLIANLCCHVEDNEAEILPKYKIGHNSYDLAYLDELKQRAFLPQGSPTSPILSNIICQKLDRRLNGLAKKVNAKFTRYADDITFSANKDVFNLEFKSEMRRIIEEQNFTINEKKVRLQGLGYRQEVTGLIVNEKVNVTKKYIREIRAMLHNWDTLGYEKASQVFKQFYKAEKSHVKKENPSFRNVLWGKLQFLKMVRGYEDELTKKYLEQFKRLDSKPLKLDLQNISITDILAVWEHEGIERAMELYYSNLEGDAKE